MKHPVALIILMCAATGLAAQASTKTTSDGVYSEPQAVRGKKLYLQHCASCHDEGLEGLDLAPALKGATFQTLWNAKSVGALVERLKDTMPADNVGSLSLQEHTDLVAYILQANGFAPGAEELKADPAALDSIKFTK